MQTQISLECTDANERLTTGPRAEGGEVAASVRGLSKSFHGTRVLHNINFDVAEGESLVLLGASGSGKTTILRIIAGLEAPDAGQVVLHGRDVTHLPARERGIGVIFQSYALFPRMTVEQNISYGLGIRRRPRPEIQETVDRLLELVRLEEHRKKYPAQLSGGQQQRVAIARTLAYQPQVLLFDEPFGALDAQTRVRLRQEIRTLLQKLKVPAIYITHDQEEALELGDRIAVINAGHIEQVGTPVEVYDRPQTEYVATFLGAANILPGVVSGRSIEAGAITVPAPAQTAELSDQQPVKLIFRPEDVYLSEHGALPSGSHRLTTGVIKQINFAGAFEHLKVLLDHGALRLASRRVTDDGKERGETDQPDDLSIAVIRTKSEANSFKLNVGDRVTVGLTTFRLLQALTR